MAFLSWPAWVGSARGKRAIPPLALVPGAYPRRGVCVARGGRHPRAACGRKEPAGGRRRAPGARALYGFVLSGGARSCPPRLARQGQDARGRAGRDEWSASDGASLRATATSGGGGPRGREAGSERAARSAQRGGASERQRPSNGDASG